MKEHIGDKEPRRKGRDTRTHQQRLLALQEAFGICKERAVRENRVNECSITKVAEIAGVAKLYLTGNKEFARNGISDSYRAVGLKIIEFRALFQDGKIASQENSRVRDLEAELDSVKSSVYEYFLELENARSASEVDRQSLKEAQDSLLMLQAKIAASSLKALSGEHPDRTVFQDRIKRIIISPDSYLELDGKYHFHDPELRHKAWINSYDSLEEELSRPYAKRLYVLVGLPRSGKSTWAEVGNVYPDRHAVIFDSTNLARFAREELLHRVKRFKDVRRCCVYFDIPLEVIRKRLAATNGDKKSFSAKELEKLAFKLQVPEPDKETWIDEMIVVRHDPDN